MKSLRLLGYFIIISLIITSCKIDKRDGNDMNENTFQLITQSEAKNIMDTQENYTILDVRTKEEYNDGHIENAICIPNETISDTITNLLPNKDQLILVYCRSGIRSKHASTKLANLGYTNIKEFGGILTWEYNIVK